MLAVAKTLVGKAPLAAHPALVGLPHLVGAVATVLPGLDPRLPQRPDDAQILAFVTGWVERAVRPPSLGELTRRLRALREELLRRVVGQEAAVHQFIDGLFNAEVVAAADTERRRPSAVFLFAGPPGVGKTFLAETAAGRLDRPFRRFDMSAYAHSHEAAGLVGTPRLYQGAQPGTLTDFVRRNPSAVLLFDEIERAHSTVINLFLQLLDAGRLQDKFTEEDADFRDTLVIFTTNVGRALYDNPNAAGVHQANALFHRSTILDALRVECDPRTREPVFPPAICSRLATGYPLLFNHLRVHDLARIAQGELSRVADLLTRRTGHRYQIAEEIPLAIVMRQGAQTDARTIRAQAEAFLKEEVFKLCQLFAEEHLDAALEKIAEVSVVIDEVHGGPVADRLFRPAARPVIAMVGERFLADRYAEAVPEVEWCLATTGDQLFALLAARPVECVLLDLALPLPDRAEYPTLDAAFQDVSAVLSGDTTYGAFDHSPPAARRYAAGQHLLERLHARAPEIPVFLLAAAGTTASAEPGAVDDELLRACVRAGGARGVIRALLGGPGEADGAAVRDALRAEILGTANALRLERLATDLARQSQAVLFDTAPALGEGDRHLRIRCRNFRLVRAVQSADASALLSEVERPTTRLTDVLGATAAKTAFAFIRDWLREPRKYALAGIDPPRGILLTGPPGTGKTLLARALAGESECAFLVASGTGFVTMWQGSGPDSVRHLFAQARRYAPSVVFIDEIDAIGAHRAEVRPGAVGHGEMLALNALLAEMDGFTQTPSRPVVVIAATNYPERLDPALLRRFNRVIEVELPTRAEREGYLTTRLAAKPGHRVSAETVQRLAAQSAGLSIADLERVLAHAAILALGNAGVLDDAVLGEAFETVLLGEAKAGADPLRTARHEAGHALAMCLTGPPPVYVTIVGRGAFGGYVAPEQPEDRRSQTRPDLQDRLCHLLAGREAERLFYGPEAGDSTGPAQDLERATSLAEAMVYDLGMAEEVGVVRIGRSVPLPEEVGARCHAAVRRILSEQAVRAQRLLTDHRTTLEAIVAALVDRNRLSKDELLGLLTPEERVHATGHPA
jgi:ATP-dependent metalloprotease FtsH